MGARFRSWRQQIKQHLVTILVIAIILVIVIALIIVGYKFDWTGFNGNNKSGKTLWDWLQLLIIPIMFAIGGFWLNQIQKNRDQKIAEAQKQREENAAKNREKLENQSRVDNQRETALQAYIDKMSELLLREHLHDSAEEDEVRNIARVRTLTVLRGLDAIRKASALQFLYESKLIEKGNFIIDLDGATLRETDLRRAKLQGAYLREADLSNTNLFKANLRETDLRGAKLQGANLSGADLSDTNLFGATLQGADLSNANLSRAIMMSANLSGANLKKAGVTTEQLETVASLKGATMPDGSIHA